MTDDDIRRLAEQLVNHIRFSDRTASGCVKDLHRTLKDLVSRVREEERLASGSANTRTG